MVCESKEELSKSIESKLKHELSIIKKDQNNFTNEIHERTTKAEAEVKRLQGRVGSLAEEKANLLKRVKSLEHDNKKLKEELCSLHKDEKDDSFTSEEMNAISALLNQNTDESSKVSKSTEKTDMDQIKENQNEDTITISPDKSATNDEFDFVMLCDSNRKFIDINKLCSNKHSKMIACNTTSKAMDIIDSPRFTVNKGIIINTGVNDLDHLSAEEIVNSQTEMINMAVKKFPEKKIILSSITPRRDDLDRQIPKINEAIHEEIKDIPNVCHVYNGNLRDNRLYFDDKHLNRRFGVPALAKNIKKELREIFTTRRSQDREAQDRRSQDDTAQDRRDQNHTVHDRRSTLHNDPARSHQAVSTDPQSRGTVGNTVPQPVGSEINDQLKYLSNLLNNLIQNNINLNQQQHYQRVMYPPIPPFFNNRLV